MAKTIALNVNGKSVTVTIDDPDMPLLYALRDNLGAARPALRLRARPVRRLHGACRRQGGALVPACRCPASTATAEGRHARRPRHAATSRTGAEGLHRGAGGAVRLLHQRHDHGVGGACSPPTRSRATPTSRRRSPTISAAAAPMSASSRAVKRAADARLREGDHEFHRLSPRHAQGRRRPRGQLLARRADRRGAARKARRPASRSRSPRSTSFLAIDAEGPGDRSIPARSISAPASPPRCAQIVAEELDVPLSKVDLIQGDTR